MGIESLVADTVDFFREHRFWAAAAVLAIVAFVYFKPKQSFKLSMAVLTLGAIIYVSSLLIDVTSEGIDRANAFTSTPRIEVD